MGKDIAINQRGYSPQLRDFLYNNNVKYDYNYILSCNQDYYNYVNRVGQVNKQYSLPLPPSTLLSLEETTWLCFKHLLTCPPVDLIDWMEVSLAELTEERFNVLYEKNVQLGSSGDRFRAIVQHEKSGDSSGSHRPGECDPDAAVGFVFSSHLDRLGYEEACELRQRGNEKLKSHKLGSSSKKKIWEKVKAVVKPTVELYDAGLKIAEGKGDTVKYLKDEMKLVKASKDLPKDIKDRKIAATQRFLYEDVNDPDFENLVIDDMLSGKKVEVLKGLADFHFYSKCISQAYNAIETGLNALGVRVNPKISKVAGLAVDLVYTGCEVAAGIVTGGLIPTVLAVSNFFGKVLGKGSEDRDIYMDAFREIYDLVTEGFKVVNDKLDTIMRNQTIILDAIHDLAGLVTDQHNVILNEIYTGFNLNTQWHKVATFLQAGQLSDISQKLLNDPGYNVKIGRFKTYSQMEAFYSRYGDTIYHGLKAVDHLVQFTFIAEGALYLRMHPIMASTPEDRLHNKNMEGLCNHFSQVLWVKAKKSKIAGKVNSLFYPCMNVEDLENKLFDLPNWKTIELSNLPAFKELYAFQVIREISKWVLLFHPFYDLIDINNTSKFHALEDVKSGKVNVSELGERLLSATVRRVDTLIGQFNLIGGDFLLPELVEAFDKDEPLGDLVHKNRVIEHNLLMYALTHKGRKNPLEMFAYHRSYHSPVDDASQWKGMFPGNKQFSYKDGQWGVHFPFKDKSKDSHWAPLPSPLSVMDKELRFFRGFNELFQIHALLEDALAGYRLTKAIPDRDQEYRSLYLEARNLLISNQGANYDNRESPRL